MRLKAAGSMLVLGLMPSGKPRAAWATWLQDLVTHRGHVAANLMLCFLAVGLCHELVRARHMLT